jgi:hypothetical protein
MLSADGRLEDVDAPAARAKSRRGVALGISGRRTS